MSAREVPLRASSYYWTADLYRRAAPANHARSAQLAKRPSETFADVTALLDTSARAGRIPYEDITMPRYLFIDDDSGEPHPTFAGR